MSILFQKVPIIMFQIVMKSRSLLPPGCLVFIHMLERKTRTMKNLTLRQNNFRGDVSNKSSIIFLQYFTDIRINLSKIGSKSNDQC